MVDTEITALSCPVPIADYPTVLLAHGGGGRLMHQLIEQMFRPAFTNSLLDTQHDSAVLQFGETKLAFTTDSYVVHPLFFPGGDIGSLAIHGTVNDLAMCGARPLYLSVGMIIEEGLPMETLWRVVQSMRHAAEEAHVLLVTGDTKVVERGSGDGIYLNTAGVGIIEHGLTIAPTSVRSGDMVILSGDLGRHGIAIMAVREGLEFESTIESDSAPLGTLVQHLLAEGIEIHCMRDLTRGGLASSLVEIAQSAGVQICLEECAIPICDQVRGACEILGLDPMYVANEGRFVCFVPQHHADRACAILQTHNQGAGACVIGYVADAAVGLVTMTSAIGSERIVDMLSGEQLPRIC